MKGVRLLRAGFALAGVMLVSAARADIAPPAPPGSCVGKTAGATCGVGATLTDAGQPGTCQVIETVGERRCLVVGTGDSYSSPPCQQMNDGDPCQVTVGGDAASVTIDGICISQHSSTLQCVANGAEAESDGCSLATGTRRTFGPWLIVSSFAALIALLRRRRS